MMEDLQLRNLSMNTQTCYLDQVSRFPRLSENHLKILRSEDIHSYQVYPWTKEKNWLRFVQTAVCALRFPYPVPSTKTGSSKTSFRHRKSHRPKDRPERGRQVMGHSHTPVL